MVSQPDTHLERIYRRRGLLPQDHSSTRLESSAIRECPCCHRALGMSPEGGILRPRNLVVRQDEQGKFFKLQDPHLAASVLIVMGGLRFWR